VPPLLAWAIHRSQQPTEYVVTTSQFGQPLCTKRSRFLLTPLVPRDTLISPPMCNAFSPIKELKLKTCVPNASIIPWRYSHSLLSRVCPCHQGSRFSVAQLFDRLTAISYAEANLEWLGQRTESHCPVPFAAAPTTFRTYAATRSLAWNGCFMHTDREKNKA